ncbi:MAG: phage baseplate assembly protein V [Roseomonas sp.]|nr:phage baseplate assembly protein V [Roseomonas sp.]
MTPADLSRALAPFSRRLMMAISRGVLRGADDSSGMQRLQVTMHAEETRDDVDRVQPFGLSAMPLPGAEVVIVCVGGARDNPIAIGVDDSRLRPTGLANGETCLYSARAGQRIWLQADGTILITGEKLRIECDVEVAGNITATGEITAGTIPLRTHRHGGVEPGSGASGVATP